MPPTESYLNSTWLVVYWTSLLLALKWAGPYQKLFVATALYPEWQSPDGRLSSGFSKSFAHILSLFPFSFHSTTSLFFSSFYEFFPPLDVTFFPCKTLYIYRVLWLVSGTLVKNRNRKHFQNPANKQYSNSQDLSNMSAQKQVHHKLPSLYTTPDFPIWWFRDFST